MVEKPGCQTPKRQIAELKERLRKNEHTIREIQKLAKIGNWEWDLKQQKLIWSDEVYRIFGYEPGAFKPSADIFESMIHPDDLDDFLTQREAMLASKREACIDHRIVLPDASVRYVQERTQLIVNDQNEVYRVIGTVQDISDRKQAEAALRENEEKFRNIFQDHSAVKLLIDPATGSIVDANEAAEKFYGWPVTTLKKMRIHQINTLSDKQVEMYMERALTEKQTYFHFFHRLSDGTMRDVDVYSSKIEVHGKQLLHSIIHDMTDHRKMIEELKTTKLAMDSAISAIAIGDSDFVLNYVNRAFLKMWGYADIDEVIGRSASDFLDITNNADKLSDLIEGSGGWSGELAAVAKNGGRFIVQVSGNAIVDPDNRTIAFMGSFVDITARKEAENDLTEKSRRLEETNTALKVLMEHRDSAREQLAENVMAGVNTLIRPYLKRIREAGLKPIQETLADVLESHLNELTAPLPMRLSARHSGITPREIEVAAMVREGKTSDEIAESLNISKSAVVFHRQNLRVKLGLKGKKRGLRTHLQEML